MIKENVYTCNKSTNWKFQQKIKNIKSQVKIPKLKNSLSKIKKKKKKSLDGLNKSEWRKH